MAHMALPDETEVNMTEHMRKRRYDALTENQKAVYWGMRANLATHDEAIEEAERQE